MRVPCSSWASGFLRYLLGMTGDHLVIRSGMRCYRWPPSAPLCPKLVPGSKSTLSAPYPTSPFAWWRTTARFHCQGEGRGFESRRPLKSLLSGHLALGVDPGRASPLKGEGGGLEPRRCPREAASGGGFRAPA